MGILPMFAVPRDFARYSGRTSKSEAFFCTFAGKIAALLLSCPEYRPTPWGTTAMGRMPMLLCGSSRFYLSWGIVPFKWRFEFFVWVTWSAVRVDKFCIKNYLRS